MTHNIVSKTIPGGRAIEGSCIRSKNRHDMIRESRQTAHAPLPRNSVIACEYARVQQELLISDGGNADEHLLLIDPQGKSAVDVDPRDLRSHGSDAISPHILDLP